MRARLTWPFARGLVATFVTGLVLVATSNPNLPPMPTAFDVVFDGGCLQGAGVVTFERLCNGTVELAGSDGGDPWTVRTCTEALLGGVFSFSSRHPRQADGGIPTADGGTRLVQPTDDLEVVCTAEPDDAGHALACDWNICAPGSSVACVRQPKCEGRLSRVR